MKNYLIVTLSLLFSVTMMVIGYVKLNGVSELDYYANINGNWDVKIISIEEYEIVGSAKSITEPMHTNLNANFNVELKNINDSIKYKVIVKNNGNIDAILNAVYIIPKQNLDDAIVFSTENIYAGEVIKVNEEKEFYVKVKYNSKLIQSSLNKIALISLEYIQKK